MYVKFLTISEHELEGKGNQNDIASNFSAASIARDNLLVAKLVGRINDWLLSSQFLLYSFIAAESYIRHPRIPPQTYLRVGCWLGTWSFVDRFPLSWTY